METLIEKFEIDFWIFPHLCEEQRRRPAVAPGDGGAPAPVVHDEPLFVGEKLGRMIIEVQ